jgi:hypothetical protein
MHIRATYTSRFDLNYYLSLTWFPEIPILHTDIFFSIKYSRFHAKPPFFPINNPQHKSNTSNNNA